MQPHHSTHTRTLYFVQRSAKHHIVYKSQITPNLGLCVRLTPLCINMLFRICLLVVTTPNVLFAGGTRIRAHVHRKIFTFIWFEISSMRCRRYIERMLILGVWYIHYIEGWESMYRTINWLLNQAVAVAVANTRVTFAFFDTNRMKNKRITPTMKTQNSTAQQQ